MCLTAVLFALAAMLWRPPSSFAQTPPVWTEVIPAPSVPDLGTGQYGHVAIYDPTRRRIYVYGGIGGSRSALNYADAAGGPWTSATVTGAPASTVIGALGVYLPASDALLVYGGEDAGGVAFSDLAMVSLANSSYQVINALGTPPGARMLHSGFFDPVRNRVIVFGGYTPGIGFLNDAWQLSLGAGTPTWSRLVISGTPPAARDGATMVYDGATDSGVLFGGNPVNAATSGVWRLSLAGTPAWIQMSPSGSAPPQRFFHAAVLDSVAHTMVVFGGYLNASLNDAWKLSLDGTGAWSQITATGPTPEVRHSAPGVFDPIARRMIIYGGRDEGLNRNLSDTQRLDLSTAQPFWLSPSSTTVPSARYSASEIYDPIGDRFLLFGGLRDDGLPVDASGTVWQLSMPSMGWSALTYGGLRPTARSAHQSLFDPVRSRMLVIGGTDGAPRMDVWAYALQGAASWSQVATTGAQPAGRAHFVAAYDSKRDRVIVMGGSTGPDSTGYTNDVWVLPLSGPTANAWQQLSPSGTAPAPRMGHTGAYDAIGDRLLIFGGLGADSRTTPLADSWELALASTPEWHPLAAAPQRVDGSVVVDPSRNVMIEFAGKNVNAFADVYQASMTPPLAWSATGTSGATSPVARFAHATAFDTRRNRMTVFGGAQTTGAALGDAWLLSGFGVPTTVTLTTSRTPELVGHVVTFTAQVTPVFAGTVDFLRDGVLLGSVPLNAGTAQFDWTLPSTPGANVITARWAGNTTYQGSSAQITQTAVTQYSTTLTISSNANPVNGLNATLTARAFPLGATGNVTFSDDSGFVATVPLTAGAASLAYHARNFGVWRIGAAYAGDAQYAPASATYPQQFNGLATALTLTTSRTPELVGHVVTFTARVTPVFAGTVDFLRAGVLLGSAPLNAGTAQFDWTLPSTPGSNVITARWAGDTTYLASSAQITQVAVTQYPTTLTISSNANPANGLNATLTARVLPLGATGNVTFSDDSGFVATVPLTAGVASLAYHARNFGVWHIGAAYAGDAQYATASATYSQQFNGLASFTTLTSNHNPAPSGTPIDLTATVGPSGATGSVRFYDGSELLANRSLVGGSVVFHWQNPASGVRALTAAYSGDTSYSPSQASLSLLVDSYSSVTTISVSSPISGAGELVEYTATIQPPAANGTVEFAQNNGARATVPVHNGGATWVTRELTPGVTTTTALFSGNDVYGPSASEPLSHYVVAYYADVLRVLAPNSGEVLLVGTNATLQWSAVSSSSLGFVSLYIARNSGPPEWELLDGHVPNTGSYLWTVAEPLSTTARLAVIDLSGRISADASDLPFIITDDATGTLPEFEAESVGEGVQLSMSEAAAANLSQMRLERAPAESGPWTVLTIAMRVEAGKLIAEDQEVEAGVTYWYRLVGTQVTGAAAVLGPVSVTTGSPREFAFSAPWPNPSRAGVSLQLAVPQASHVRISVLDVQGREVAIVAEGDYRPGTHPLSWNGRTAQGRVPNGVYFIRCATSGRVFVSRIAIVS